MVNFHKALEDLRERQRLLSLPIRVAGTGHRPDKLGGYNTTRKNHKGVSKLCDAIEDQLVAMGTQLVISGGALGYDQYLGVVAIDLNLPLLLALPCKPFGDNWPETSLGAKIHKHLMAKAAYVHYVIPMTYKQYGPQCMQERNEWMVLNSTALLACWDGSPGGTGNCMKYAEKHQATHDYYVCNIWSEEYRKK